MDYLISVLTGIEWAALIKIIGVDILLGGDNAIVIGAACANVPTNLRNKAIFGGTAAAIVLRIVLLVGLAAFIEKLMFVKIVCGALLLAIGIKLSLNRDEEEGSNIAQHEKVWQAIKVIAFADLVMSIDNVFAVTGAAQSAGEHATIYAAFGVLLSIPFIVFGATIISKLMTRFPQLITMGGALLGWIGVEMIITDPHISPYIGSWEEGKLVLKALGAAGVIAAAMVYSNLTLELKEQ